MKNKIPIVLSTTVLCILVSLPIKAQWTITPTAAATQLAQLIAGYGVTVTNASLTCGAGSAATFAYTGTHTGLTGGVLLSTGNATTSAQTYTTFAGSDMNVNVVDPDLIQITSNANEDLCRLEFDFVPVCPVISLRYVFASEEYPDFVGSTYNDAFGIFITGPNPAGGSYAAPANNIARLGNGAAVAINSVNQNYNPTFFVPNADCVQTTPSYSPVTGAHYNDVVYGGLTTPVASTVAVIPCQSYHLKFAIADAGDGNYDSGVLISNSGVACVNSPTVSVLTSNSTCSGAAGSATVQVAGASPSYQWLPGGQTTASVSGLAPGTYTCVLSYTNGCASYTTSETVTITAPAQSPTLAVGANMPCAGSTLSLTAQSNASGFAWSGPGGFATTVQNPVVPGITPAQAGVYTVTATNAGGCAVSATIRIEVSTVSTPTAAVYGVPCSGNTLTLSAQPNGASYSWSGPGGFSSAQQFPVLPQVSAAGNGVYTLTATQGNCTGTHTVNVQVMPTPTVSLSSNSPLCEGNNLVLQASGAATYTWTGPSGYVSSQASSSIAPATADQSGVYMLRAANQGCVVTRTLQVVVNPKPVLLASSNSPQCEGSTLQLSASGGATYQWTGPNGFNTAAQNPSVIQAGTVNSGTYQVTALSVQGCSATAAVPAEIRMKPVATATVNSPVCEGAVASFTAEGGSAYAWTGPSGFTSSVKNPVLNGVSAAQSGTYTVTVSLQGCSATYALLLQVNPSPTVTTSANSPVCVGSPLNLHASGGGTYSWSGPQGFGSTQQNPVIDPVIDVSGGVYTVTVTLGSCQAVQQMSVVVNDPPAAWPQSNGPLCAGNTLSLSVNDGTAWQWAGPNNFSSSLQSVTIGSVTPAHSGIYTVTASNPYCSRTSTLQVQVYTSVAASLSQPGPACVGQSLQFNTNAAGQGLSYAWTGPAGFTSTIANPVIDHAVAANTGTYSVEVKTANGCASTASAAVVVNTQPVANVGSNSPLCEGGKLLLQASGGTSYQWEGPAGFVSSAQYPGLDPASQGMSGVYTVTVSNGSCAVTGSVPVQVRSLPQGSFTAVSRAGCPVFCTDFSAQVGSDIGLQWNFGNGHSGNAAHVQQVCFPTTGSYDVSLVLTDLVAGCTHTIIEKNYITVYPAPIAGFGWDAVATDDGAQSDVQFNDQAQGIDLQSWSWNFGDGGNLSAVQNPQHAYQSAGTYEVTQQVTNAYGCISTARGTLEIKDAFTLYIPNAFTPGKGDGLNDVFNVAGAGFDPEQFEMLIFDRWGELIFKTTNSRQGWDGRAKGRELAEQGVYVYKITVKDGTRHLLREYTGHVTLL